MIVRKWLNDFSKIDPANRTFLTTPDCFVPLADCPDAVFLRADFSGAGPSVSKIILS